MENQPTQEQKPKKKRKWLWILVGIVIFFVIIIVAGGGGEKKETVTPTIETPVTEATVGDITFKLIEVKDLGNILRRAESKYPEWGENLTTEGKFIKVTVEAKNVGKEATSWWDLFEIIDNQEREFHEASGAYDWVPKESECAAELQPGFSPKTCTKIYEVAADSTGLKVRVGHPIGRKALLDLGL